jgi:hypothetical protein
MIVAATYHQYLDRPDQLDKLHDCHNEVLEEISIQRWYVSRGLWYRS